MTKIHKRSLDGIPIVDAKKELRVFVNEQDKKTGIKKDPAHCAFSNACRRLFGSHSVVFFRTLTYVELPDGKGGIRIERFTLTENMQRAIAKFDRTGRIAKDGYLLSPPRKGMTLDGRLTKDRRYRDSGMRKAAEERREGLPRKKEPTYVRSGKGLVQFITTEKKSFRKMMNG